MRSKSTGTFLEQMGVVEVATPCTHGARGLSRLAHRAGPTIWR